MSRAVHQLVHTLSYGDAISTEVLGLRRVLKNAGVASDIYAINVHPHYRCLAKDYRELSTTMSGELILHYSLGSPLNALYRACTSAQRTLIYHNLTPARWFAQINPRVCRDIEEGMRELPELCGLSARCVADSIFNAQELARFGYHAEVLGLCVDPVRWDAPPNPGLESLMKRDPQLHVLHVGRLAPNKCVEDIIRAFYFLHYHIERRSKLWLVGTDIDTEMYSFALKRLAYELKVGEAVFFTGALSDPEVAAMYRGASVYVCMSEHEGFCLPLVEAMHFELPVVAYDQGAVGETLASGGVLVQQKRPAELAELIAEVHRNQSLRQRLVEAGRRRAHELSVEKFDARARALFCPAAIAH